ncbi:MAG: hypothetical protein V5A14_01410 [Desulfohalobiaceae bacterium]
MTFLATTGRILMLDGDVYSRIYHEGKTLRYCFVNLLILGILYGLLALLFSGMLVSGEVALQYKILFLMVGVGMVFVIHVGISLFLWVFTKAAAGGVLSFFPLYFNVGISLAAAWPLALVLSATQSGIGGIALYGLLSLVSLYVLSSVFVSVKSTSRLSGLRVCGAFVACAAVLVSMVYIYAF